MFVFPDDVILNTRRAFSVSTTNLNGYSDLGAPEGRYFAPANSADCIQLKAGDCAERAVVLLAPWFTRFDIGLTKRIRMGGNKSLEFRADVLNVFDNVNFTHEGSVTDAGLRRRHFPDRFGLSGSRQHLRSRRPARAAGDSIQLVAGGVDPTV